MACEYVTKLVEVSAEEHPVLGVAFGLFAVAGSGGLSSTSDGGELEQRSGRRRDARVAGSSPLLCLPGIADRPRGADAEAGPRGPRSDPRPYLVASVALCAVQTAVVAWRAAGQQAPESELTRQAFDLLSTGLDYPAGPTTTGH